MDVVEAPAMTQEQVHEALRAGFPFPQIRPTQNSALGAIAKARVEGKKFVVIEAPTGLGKSGIAIASARYIGELGKDHLKSGNPGSYILTSQKSLQTQLMDDFSPLGLVEMKGKNNYPCHGALTPTDCDTFSSVSGFTCDNCPYRIAKDTFAAAKMGVSNYAYFMHESLYANELPPKELLVADEAHNAEKEILNMVEIRLTPQRLSEFGVESSPTFNAGDEEEAIDWLAKTVIPALKGVINDLRIEINLQGEAAPAEMVKRFNNYQSLLSKIQMFSETEQPSEWVVWTDENRNVLIKPLTGSMFADDFMFKNAGTVLLMSATILDFDTFRRNLGIARENSVCLRAASDFPVENRKIVFWPSGDMGYKNIRDTLPTILSRIEILLNRRFGDVKGVIHTHTYKITEQLIQHLRSAGLGHRIISHSNMPGDRDQAVLRHITSPEPTVLISPSMTEGLDLKGDLSRFQIICKVPYPYIDPYTDVRMKRDPAWYQLQTALVLMQASGRSIRSAEDFATTVILDSAFGKFLSQNESILPRWWRAAITVKA